MYLEKTILALVCVLGYTHASVNLPLRNPTLDQNLFEDVLDEELCSQQLAYIQNNTLIRMQFLDAGIRMPRGILNGNMVDLGNYYQCLEIYDNSGDSVIEGKYCSINVPLDQEIQLPSLPELPEIDWPEWPWPNITIPETRQRILQYQNIRTNLLQLMGIDSRTPRESSGFALKLAACIPKSCTTRQGVDALYWNLPSPLHFEDNYCRLPNDKPRVPADYVAAVGFSLIGLLTIVSTWYDVHHTVVRGRDPKQANTLYKSFSVYSNTKSLVSYSSNPKVIQCMDGIRVIAMIWVIVGHTYFTQSMGLLMNPLHVVTWMESFHSIWITAAPISVDTFFMMSGLLLIYTTSGKMKSMAFLPKIPLFYLNRLLRMFPILAAAVLLQVSWLHRITDGPYWNIVQRSTENCRKYWWSTLLHIQNYANPNNMCLGHTWYLAVDTQLYFIAPIVMVFVFYSKKAAWISLTLGLIAILTAATTYNAVNGFRGAAVGISHLTTIDNFMTGYYINTLTRGSPFFVGMLFGYILYSTKDKKMRLGKPLVALLWLVTLLVSSSVIFITYPLQQASWDQPILDIIINSFMRPAWAACLGWMIVACQHGYGGILNWFLTLKIWKLPAKLSYAMYIFHYDLINLVNATGLTPFYFTETFLIFRFFGDLMLAVLVAFLATLLVDAPFAVLIKMAIGGDKRTPPPFKVPEQRQQDNDDRFIGVVNDAYRYETKTQL